MPAVAAVHDGAEVGGRCARPRGRSRGGEPLSRPDHRRIYDQGAAAYDRLVSREDHAGNIARALHDVAPAGGRDVLELGAGTGRLTRLLAPRARRLLFLDASRAMLGAAVQRFGGRTAPDRNWLAAVADHRALPVPDASVDLVVAGWTLGYLVVWDPSGRLDGVEAALAEIDRALRPGGTVILLETLGTGRETPRTPDNLAAYFDLLARRGFRSRWIRTDYRFDSLQEAQELAGFFFGPEMAALARAAGAVLPECTGVWWRARPA